MIGRHQRKSFVVVYPVAKEQVISRPPEIIFLALVSGAISLLLFPLLRFPQKGPRLRQ
jgi:hypothetical protein